MNGVAFIIHFTLTPELWYLHWHASLLCGAAGEFCEGGPFCCIVNADVEWVSVAEAVDEACVHGVVHLVGHAEAVALFPEECGGGCAEAVHVAECGFSGEYAGGFGGADGG